MLCWVGFPTIGLLRCPRSFQTVSAPVALKVLNPSVADHATMLGRNERRELDF